MQIRIQLQQEIFAITLSVRLQKEGVDMQLEKQGIEVFLMIVYTQNTLQFIMRNNSLRQQAWKNKQQANLFKKVTQLFPNDPLQDQPACPQNSYKANYHQHSELKWLQRLVTDMNCFKEGQRAQIQRQVPIQQPAKVVKEVTVGCMALSIAQDKNLSKEVKKDGKEEGRKSGRKIKFQIISNKENKVPAEKRSIPTSSSKNSDKIKNKSNKKIIPSPGTRQKFKMKDQNIEIKYKTRVEKSVNEGSKMVTQSFAVQSPLQVKNADSLWRNGLKELSLQSNKLADLWEKPKKSIGRIVKNSNNESVIQKVAYKVTKTSPKNERNVQCLRKQQQTEQTAKRRSQKVYIKLHTQKLSKYLMQSEVKEVSQLPKQKQLNLESEQFTKYCPTKRGDHIVIRAINTSSNNESEIRVIDKTEVIQRKKNVERNMKTHDSLSKIKHKQPQTQHSNYLSYKKEKGKISDPYQSQVAVQRRSKSEQRKLNQISRAVTQNESVNQEIKVQETQIVPSFSFNKEEQTKKVDFEDKVLQKLKLSKFQQKGERSKPRFEHSQKIFTLNSDRGSENEQKSSIILHQKQVQRSSDNVLFDQSSIYAYDFVPNTFVLNETQLKTTKISPKIEAPKQIHEISPIVTSQSIESENQNYSEMLKQLFNFLDEGKRGLLTGSNCKADGLTEQLKLLLSPIVNQIKSKKKTYSLQKFMLEGQQVLKVKQEVYKTSRTHLKKPKISQILRQNIEILIKKSPFDFLQQTHTYSYYETKQNSKRQSCKDSHSIVISKPLSQKSKPHTAVQCIQSQRIGVESSKLELEIDLQEPEFYFQKKYGINSTQLVEVGLPEKRRSDYKCLSEVTVVSDI